MSVTRLLHNKIMTPNIQEYLYLSKFIMAQLFKTYDVIS